MITVFCRRIGYFWASKYRTSKGILHQNYTCKYQNHFLKVNMQSFAIISNVTCQSTIHCLTDTSSLFEEKAKMLKSLQSSFCILHLACILHSVCILPLVCSLRFTLTAVEISGVLSVKCSVKRIIKPVMGVEGFQHNFYKVKFLCSTSFRLNNRC